MATITHAPFKLWSMDDVFDLDPPAYIMDYWLLKGGRTVVWGKYGSGKSLLSLEWAIHLALGRDWSEYEVPEPVKVIYIYAEGASNLQERLAAWTEAHGFGTIADLMAATDGRLMFLDVDPDEPDLNLRNADDVARLKATVEDFKPDLIVFDPLAKLWPGLDNNDESQVGALLQVVNDIRGPAAVLLVTHARKDQTTYRGVTTLPDLSDVVASMSKLTDGDGSIRLEITPHGDGHKHKFREPSVQRNFQLTQIGIGPSIQPKLQPGYAVYLKHLSGPPAGSAPSIPQQVILQFVSGVEYTPKEIKEALGLPSEAGDSSHINRALKGLAEDGYLSAPSKGRYQLTEKGERWLESLTVAAAEPPLGVDDQTDQDLDNYLPNSEAA